MKNLSWQWTVLISVIVISLSGITISLIDSNSRPSESQLTQSMMIHRPPPPDMQGQFGRKGGGSHDDNRRRQQK